MNFPSTRTYIRISRKHIEIEPFSFLHATLNISEAIATIKVKLGQCLEGLRLFRPIDIISNISKTHRDRAVLTFIRDLEYLRGHVRRAQSKLANVVKP